MYFTSNSNKSKGPYVEYYHIYRPYIFSQKGNLTFPAAAALPLCRLRYSLLSELQSSVSKFIGLNIFGYGQKWQGNRAYSSTSRQSLHKPGSIYGLDT